MGLKESEILELKRSTSELKEAIISITAILNKHQKGEIYFGIKNDGKVVGQKITEKTIRDVSKTISDNIEPKVFPKINEVILDRKFYIVFKRKHRVAGKTVEKTVEKIIKLIKDNPKVTEKEISQETGLSRKCIEWNINKLKKKGLLKRIGPAKGGY